MIWYFLAGLIGGAVGMVWFARWWMERHTITIKVSNDEFEEMKTKMEEDNNDRK